MGKIKKLKFKNVNAFPADWSEIDLYPVTHIAAVFDDDGNTLEDLLKGYQNGSSGGGDFDLLRAYKVTPTNEMPNLNRKEETYPPSGEWDISTNDAIGYVWVTYAKRQHSGIFNKWSDNYIWTVPVCIGTIIPSVKTFFAYIFAVGTSATDLAATLILEDGKAAGSYNFDTNTLTVPPEGGWVTSHALLSPDNSRGEYIYYTYRTFYSDGTETYWYSPPIKYITSSVITPDSSLSKSVLGVIFASGKDGYSIMDEKPLFNSEGFPLGSYDFEANGGKGQLTPPNNWYLSPNSVSRKEGEHIYYTWRMFFEDGTINDWHTPPLQYLTSADIVADSASNSSSFGVEAYIAVAIGSNTPLIPYYSPDTLTISDPFNFAEGQLVKYPNKESLWYASPQLAIEAYAAKYEVDHLGEIDVDKKKTACVVYVSYNNYIADYIDSTWLNPRQTGWSEPVKYINIDDILDTAEKNATRIATEAITNALEDFNNALEMLTANGELVAEVLNSLEKLYGWTEVSLIEYDALPSTNKITGSYANLEALLSLTGAEYAGKYVNTSDGKYYSYTVTSEVLTTLLARLENQYNELDNKISELYTTVNLMTPDRIRLQASKGNLNKVCWTNIGKYTNGTAYDGEAVNFDALPGDEAITNKTLKFGDVYRVRATETNEDGTINYIYYLYRADYATSTGFLNILNDNLHFGIARNTSGAEVNKATFNMYFGDWNNSIAELTANTIVLNGDTVADAIAAKYLNIDNTTYLFGKYGTTGSYTTALADGNLPEKEPLHTNNSNQYPIALFGAGTGGSTKFNSDGSGWLAGGLIQWGKGIGKYNTPNNFGVSISGHIVARSGFLGSETAGWTIGIAKEGTNEYAALLGHSNNDSQIQVSTEFITSITTSDNITSLNWYLNKNGSGLLARSNISWETNGTLTVNGNIIAKRLTLGGTGGAVMNFETYNEAVHGVATNGFSYIDNGEPILYGEYNNSHYCVPLLKMGGSSGVTYQLGTMLRISNTDTNMTATSLANAITSPTNKVTLYRVKESGEWIYKEGSINGSNVTGTYVSYQTNRFPREVYQFNSSSHFSTHIYTGQNDQYKIRVFVINKGRVNKAYDTYIAKPVYISMVGSIVNGATYLDYKVSEITWEYLNAVGKEGTVPKFLLCSENGSTLYEYGPQAVTGLITSETVGELTLSGAYNIGVGAITSDSAPFGFASGGISGDSGSSGTSVELVTSLTTSGSSNKAYSCSAFNNLLLSSSVVKIAQATNTININGAAYTILICDSEPSVKDEHTIYLIKE